jgi:cation transport regulator ChaC
MEEYNKTGGSVVVCELVFAYGSNMDAEQMKRRCPDSKDELCPLVAKAEGWKLCFPRYSERRRGGVGSIIRAPGETVWGVVYRIVSHEDLVSLDRAEGIFTNAYHREWLTVKGGNGQELKTWTYFAVPQDDPPKDYPPSPDYLELYIRGAEQFDVDVAYIDKLRKIATLTGHLI